MQDGPHAQRMSVVTADLFPDNRRTRLGTLRRDAPLMLQYGFTRTNIAPDLPPFRTGGREHILKMPLSYHESALTS